MAAADDLKKCYIDLHLHLDGSISVESARELAKIEGVTLPEDDGELRDMLSVSDGCRDLNEYLEKFALPCSLIQSRESIAKAVCNLCRELADEGCIYAEIRFAPQKSMDKGLSQEEVVKAAIKGLDESGFHGQLILCCMRDAKDNSRENLETVRLTAKYLNKGVCACDLAGAEALFPNERYGYVFDKARECNVPFTIHAGEALGADSVKTAVDYGARRIGHGIRAIEDEEVMRILKEKQIPLEICPTSNLQTCVFPDYKSMPIEKFRDYGISVTINSDNRSVSGTDAKKELERIMDAFGYGEKEKKEFLIHSANAAFLDDESKQKLIDRMED